MLFPITRAREGIYRGPRKTGFSHPLRVPQEALKDPLGTPLGPYLGSLEPYTVLGAPEYLLHGSRGHSKGYWWGSHIYSMSRSMEPGIPPEGSEMTHLEGPRVLIQRSPDPDPGRWNMPYT